MQRVRAAKSKTAKTTAMPKARPEILFQTLSNMYIHLLPILFYIASNIAAYFTHAMQSLCIKIAYHNNRIHKCSPACLLKPTYRHKKSPMTGTFLRCFNLSGQMHQRYRYLFVSVRTVHRMLYVQLVLAQSCQ